MHLISKIGEILVSYPDFRTSLFEVLKVLYSYWEVNISFISFFDPHTETLRIMAYFGLKEEEANRAIFRSGEGIVGKVYKNGIPMVLRDLNERVYLNLTGLRERLERGTSFLAVPIKNRGEVIGVLAIFKNLSPEDSIERAIELLQEVAVLISMAYQMERKLTYERITWDEERRILTEALEERVELSSIIGQSKIMRDIMYLVKRISLSAANVLITGESGTGKTLFAKIIHHLSPRRKKPFVIVNCSAIPETLLEAELFGYEKGAFTGAYTSKKGKFELAQGGTIFLDEIGDLSLSIQPKLLRVIQEKEFEKLGKEEPQKVDVRIISATNRNLEELIKVGLFREDLYYRLNVITLHLPPLRERKEDISNLVEYFLHRFNLQYEKEVTLSAEVMEVFYKYNWPGNVRELQNLMERLVILCDRVITLKDLPSYLIQPEGTMAGGQIASPIEKSEKEEIIRALEKTGYVKSRAAKLLGLTLRQLDYRIKKYQIPLARF